MVTRSRSPASAPSPAARRSPLEADPPVIEFGNVRVDLAAHEVNKADAAGARSPIKLTPTEWHILEVLVRNPRRPVTKHYLLTTVWGPAYETEGGYLRSTSYGCAGSWNRSRPRYLLTEPGMGYRFAPDVSAEPGV